MRPDRYPMGLSELAAGVKTTETQRDRGVAAVDRTGDSLADRLVECESALPTDAAAAAAVVERYAAGGSVGQAAAVGDVPRVTAAKVLHLVGESVSPLGPTGRTVVRDWIDGDLSRTEALSLTRASPAAFALAAYVETHEPIPAAQAAVQAALDGGARTSAGDAALAGAVEPPEELR
jgi:hypothetical protein